MEEPAKKAPRERKPVRYWIHDLEDTPDARRAARCLIRSTQRDVTHRLITAEELKQKTFQKLRSLGKKWDLVITMDTGGSKFYPHHELSEFSDAQIQLPYTFHRTDTRRDADKTSSWQGRIRQALGDTRKPAPRVLVLESDVGGMGSSAHKLQDVRNELEAQGARATIVSGLTHTAYNRHPALDASAIVWGKGFDPRLTWDDDFDPTPAHGKGYWTNTTRVTELIAELIKRKNRTSERLTKELSAKNPARERSLENALAKVMPFYNQRPGLPMVQQAKAIQKRR